MTRATDIAAAVAAEVDAIGLVLYQHSSRFVSIEQAKGLLHNLVDSVDVVIVLVNPEVDFVNEVIKSLPIQYLQFHGEESQAFCEQFSLPYIKAIPAISAVSIMQGVRQHPNAAAILLDAPSSVSRGGTGLTFDWQNCPRELTKPLILAGGLNALNVGQAISDCAPFAVDVCSGIEISPGMKCHAKMRDFIDAVWGKHERI